MNKIITYIRLKILQLLGISSIVKDMKDKRVRIEQLEQQLRLITGEVKVGVDYHHYDRRESWAVVCLEGDSKTFIQFYNLKDKDVKDIEHFLKFFETKNKIIDRPISMKKAWFM